MPILKSLVNMKRETQVHQVVEAMRKEGGYATLRHLNEIVDFTQWKTKTPEATIRRIVQQSRCFFKIQPGLWALEESREQVLRKFELKLGNRQSEELFSHGYYQGLLVEIGKFHHQTTYIPAQDQKRNFIGRSLGCTADKTELPFFTYEYLMRRARTVDVIWFNSRMMPSHFFEVEHTTDIKNSLSKFYELQDFYAKFYIVADKSRQREFEDKLQVSMLDDIKKRVRFLEYCKVVEMYEGCKKISNANW